MSATVDQFNQYVREITERYSPQPRTYLTGYFAVLEDTADYLWPGAIVSGNALMRGHERPHSYSLPLASINLTNAKLGESTALNNPTRESVTHALTNLRVVPDKLPTHTTFNFHSASTVYELAMNMNVSTSAFGASFGASATAKKNRETSLIAMEMCTTYFSVTMDTADVFWREPTDLLAPSVLSREPSQIIPPDDLPLVVTGLTYGKRAYIVASNVHDVRSWEAAVKASYYAAAEGLGSVEGESVLDESTMEGAVYCLDKESSVAAIVGLSGVDKFMANYIASDPDTVGVIGVQVKTLANEEASIPRGPVTAVLRSPVRAQWTKRGSKERHDNIKLYGILAVRSGPDYGKMVWEAYDYVEKDVKPDRVWAELTHIGGKPSALDLGSDLPDSGFGFLLDPVDGEFYCVAELYDYYHGSDSEKLGDGISGRLTYSSFSQDQIQTLEVTCESAEWGSCVAMFEFDIYRPSS